MSSRIGKGPVISDRFDEEIERIVDGHVGDEIDLDLEFRYGLRKDKTGQEIAVGILLQIDEMIGRTGPSANGSALSCVNAAPAVGG